MPTLRLRQLPEKVEGFLPIRLEWTSKDGKAVAEALVHPLTKRSGATCGGILRTTSTCRSIPTPSGRRGSRRRWPPRARHRGGSSRVKLLLERAGITIIDGWDELMTIAKNHDATMPGVPGMTEERRRKEGIIAKYLKTR